MEKSIKKPNFSGTWELDLDKSSIKLMPKQPPLKSAIFVIDHKEPHWILERTHFHDDIESVLRIEQDINGKQVIHERAIADVTIKARMYWEKGTIIFDSEIMYPDGVASNVVRYMLADNGNTFIADENFQSKWHSHENHFVFFKK